VTVSSPLEARAGPRSVTRRGDFVAFCANALQQGRGLILPVCSSLGAMLALAGPAHSEGAAGESTPNQLAPGPALTIADLEGAKIRIKLVNEQLIQREGVGPQFPVTGESDWNITVEPGAKIGWSFQPTAHTPRGTRVGQKIATTATLDTPWNTPNGEATWQFTEGTLLFVRSFKNGGAYRMSIAFKQDGQNLTCSATNVFARERGKNSLTTNSAIDGAPITIFSWKTVSSSCDVTR
jgi:hypothetical protein